MSIENRDDLLKDLQLIREAAKKNNSVFKYISISEGLKNVSLAGAAILFIISGALLWISEQYGSFRAAPAGIRVALYAVSALCCAGLALFKIISVLKLIRRQKKDMSFVMLIREIYTRAFLQSAVPSMLSIVVFCVYLPAAGLAHLIVPVTSILVALILFSMTVQFYMKSLLVAGVWLFLSGSITLFVSDIVSEYILVMFTFGAGMLVLYFSTLWCVSREKRG